MEYRRLGRTGIEVGVIGLGLEHLAHVEDSEIDSIIGKAGDAGVNYLDAICAESHVRDSLGRALKGKRHQFVINGHLGAAIDNGQPSITRDIPKVKTFIEDLLIRLDTDYLDLVTLLFVDTEDDFSSVCGPDGILELADSLRREGKARYIKLSCHRVPSAMRAVESGFFDVIMFPVNPLFDILPGDVVLDDLWRDDSYSSLAPSEALSDRRRLYHACSHRDIGLVVMKAFAAGWLFNPGLYADGQPLTPVQCISYSLSQPGVSTVAVGVSKVSELDAALRYTSATPDEVDWAMAVNRLKFIKPAGCMYCNHCLPCPQGIDVGRTLRILHKSQSHGSPEPFSDEYELLPQPASACTECCICVERCPFGIKVPSQMSEAARILG